MDESIVDIVSEVLDREVSSSDLDKAATGKSPEELALVLESLPIEQRVELWDAIADELKVSVLVAMRSDARESVMKRLGETRVMALLADVDAGDLIELAESLPDHLVDRAFLLMDAQQRGYFEIAQQYSDDQIGHWINQDMLIVPQNARVGDSMRVLRREIPEYTDMVYLVDRTGHFAGCVSALSMTQAPSHTIIAELKEESYPTLLSSDEVYSAADKIERSHYQALPVVDEKNILLGRMHVGIAMALIRETSESQLMALAGMDEDVDLFSPVRKSASTRAIWLGINLLTALLASAFIGLFEATIQQVVALAVLMPIVASMGGIAGSQTLTLIVRGLALGQIGRANMSALLNKELRVGLLNGCLWALVIGVVAGAWFASLKLGLVIGFAILINIFVAGVAGVLIPVVLDRYKLDPALSGSVILTTVTDVVGFVAFLGIGTLLLL
jgi:magnesium transporter